LQQLQSQKLDAKEIYLQKHQLQFEYFKLSDAYLDKKPNEPYWLKQDAIAQIVSDSLMYLAQSKIKLWSFCIMPNHVHAVLNLIRPEDDLFKIMQQHKSFTSVQANKILGRTGPFWDRETYDHIIRPGQFEALVGYTVFNPVQAGFVQKWNDWKWTYIHPEIAGAFKDT
jgi:putative transposase